MFLIEGASQLGIRDSELIAEKISIPGGPERATYLSRPRLLAPLGRNLHTCTATIITGRAGTGKTTLALDFARRCARIVTWYKVDAPEADLRSFFLYLVASINRVRPNFGSDSLAPLLRTNEADETLLAEAFLYDLVEGENQPLLIVIEDLHLVCDSKWLVPCFQRLLPLLPSNVHMLITSRTMPATPLWRMRSKQTLSVIDEDYLSFTRLEAIELFESYGLSSEHAAIALDYTHGRASSLDQFAACMAEGEHAFPGLPSLLAAMVERGLQRGLEPPHLIDGRE
jgi:LuxR family transcriptional regulator, maltose regulon positive regulatory protein